MKRGIFYSPYLLINNVYFIKILFKYFICVKIKVLGKFYESKRRKATGLKQQFVVMVAGLPRSFHDFEYHFFTSFLICLKLAKQGEKYVLSNCFFKENKYYTHC